MTPGKSSPSAAGVRPYAADLVALAALLIAIAIVSWYGFATSSFLGRIDIVTQYLPWYSYLGEELRSGNIPGWIPYSFGGAPFAGDPQSGWGYLPAMVIFTIHPGRGGFETLIVFHFLLAAGATYAFARAVGLGVLGSFVASAAFTFSGLVERSRCCTIHVEVAVWIPVGFLGIEMAARSRSWSSRIAWWVLTGIAASQIIAGWIGVGAAYGLLAVGAYAGYRVILAPDREERALRDRVVRAAVMAVSAGITTGVLAATAVLPRLDVVDRSNLAGGDYGRVGQATGPFNGWTLKEFADRILTPNNTSGRYYASVAVLSLAILAPFLARRRFHVPFFLPFTVVVGVLTLNKTVIHEIMFLIPSFERLHEHRPPHILTLFPFGLALLAGATVAIMIATEKRRWWQFGIAFLPLVIVLLVRNTLKVPGPTIRLRYVAVAAMISLLLAGAFFLARRQTAIVAAVGIALLVLWDPAFMTVVFKEQSGASHTRGNTIDTYAEVDPVALYLREKLATGEPFRYAGYDPQQLVAAGSVRTYHVSYSQPETMELLVNNRAIQLKLEDIQGYNPVQIQRYVDFLDAVNGTDQSYHAANVLFRGATSPLIKYLNVRYMILPLQTPAGRPDLLHLSQRYPTIYRDEHVRVIERTDALPRAWTVHEAVTTASDAESLVLMASNSFDPRVQVILPAGSAIPTLEPVAGGSVDSVEAIESSPDEIRLNVVMGSAGMVVLSELWDPGWSVQIDGQESDLYRVDSLLRGVVVPAGEHTVILRYEPVRLVASAWITGLGWIVVIVGYAVFGFVWMRSRRKPPTVHSYFASSM